MRFFFSSGRKSNNKDRVVLTSGELRQLIEQDAQALGLPTEEAIQRARARTLPRGPIADDLALLLEVESS